MGAGQQIIDEVNLWIGASLKNRGQELREFIARGVDDPQRILDEHVSDCALFALAVWHSVGVRHALCESAYITGRAMQWIGEIAEDLRAIRWPNRDGMPTPGSLMQYYTHRPSFDDHVEFLMSEIVAGDNGWWWASHAGGGRAYCAVGRGESDIRWNAGRPLQMWIDVEALLGGLSGA